jgi:glycosyltransferase involved in cell wall biosynthesis
MKVLHLLPSLTTGGMETFALSLAQEQLRTGLHAEIAVFSGEQREPAVSHQEGVRIWEFSRKFGSRNLAKEIRKVIEREDFRILHAHNETSAIFGAMAIRGMSVALVTTIHNGDRVGYSLKQRLENFLAFRKCRAIVSVSEGIAETMSAREGVRRRRIRVIKNGIRPVAILSDASKAGLRAELGLPADGILIGCVGRLVPVKNHILFLSAFRKAIQRLDGGHPEKPHRLIFVLIGDGPLRSVIEAEIRALDLGTSVRMLGDRKDVPALLNILDIFALPSLNEGHSISLLEACSAGLPVIASDRGGNPTLVDAGKTGLLVGPEDVDGIAGAIINLSLDAGLRRSMGLAGRALQQSRFGMDACAAEYRSLYQSVDPSPARG